MPPALILIRIGVWPIPIPVLLLWPLIAVVWIVALAARAVGHLGHASPGANAGWPDLLLACLQMLRQMRGLRMDLRSHQGTPIHVHVL